MLAEGAAKRLTGRARLSIPSPDDMTATASPHALRDLVAQHPAAGAGTQLFWLLDQSALPQGGWLRRQIGGADWLDLLSGRSETRLNGASPIIVATPDSDAPIRGYVADELYRVGRFANAISLIETPLSISDLQAALCQRARIDLPGIFEAVLRYFDTRTLPLLPRLLTADQYARFVLSIASWTYLDRKGALQRLPLAAVPAEGKAYVQHRLQLDEAQETMLINDGLTDAVIDLLITQSHPALHDRTPPEQFDAIDPWVQAARGFGLCEPVEALAFVGKTLAEGIAFSHTEPWHERLSAYRQKRCSIDEAFA
jgi:Domain of unknown function (DUF4123)